MNFPEFADILRNLTLVTRVRFNGLTGPCFSLLRTFEGWVLIDSTGGINFRFTEFDTDPSDRGVVSLRFRGYYIGAVRIHEITEVDYI